ncbi:MAG: NUDIX hydrolase [Bacteroidetes bacterium]|nr:NUDIX hydrolase [Bacteroidota bacterium]
MEKPFHREDLHSNFLEFLKKGKEEYLPHVSVDCVIFGFFENQLKVLLLQWKESDEWNLPGGFIQKKEHTDEAAIRILKERTGLEKIFLRQFHTFGEPERGRSKDVAQFFSSLHIDEAYYSWLLERFVSIGYYALVNYQKVSPVPDFLSQQINWFDVKNLPDMILDHRHIVEKAVFALQKNIHTDPVGYELLPEKFILPELRAIYETILDKKIDRRNFQRKLISSNILERLEKRMTGKAHKAPFEYRFNLERYREILEKGSMLGF